MSIIVGKEQESHNGLNKKRKDIVMELEKFEEVDLTKQLWDAIEMQYGDYIRFIKEEFNRQIREA
jgi:hypothetical protein